MTNDNNQIVSHFWVASTPFCEASLFLCPQPGASVELTTTVELFDPDGCLINKLSVSPSSGFPITIELDPLMEGCKFESGIRHAHLIVSSTSAVRPMCRLHNRGGATILSPLHTVTQERSVFAPVALGAKRTSIIAMINYGAEEASVRFRLMLANRNPDTVCNIPPFGARIVCVEREFQEVLLSGFGKRRTEDGQELEEAIPDVRAYVRLGCRTNQPIGVQHIEGVERGEQGVIFSATSS